MSESALKPSTKAEVLSLVAMVDVMRLQDVPVTRACQKVGLDRNAYYNYKRTQKTNGGTATTDTAEQSNPTETQGAFTKDTTVSRDAERNG
jgi:hypothetical protein